MTQDDQEIIAERAAIMHFDGGVDAKDSEKLSELYLDHDKALWNDFLNRRIG